MCTCSGSAEFITLVSSEANELCDKEKKSTLTPEHVLTALEVSVFSSLFLTSQ
jgi:histone H3/H4